MPLDRYTMACHPTLTSLSVHHSSHQWTALFLSLVNIPIMFRINDLKIYQMVKK